MRTSLLLFFVFRTCVASTRIDFGGKVGEILSKNRAEMSDLQLNDSGLVKLATDLVKSLSESGSLTDEGKIRVKDAIIQYMKSGEENVIVDGSQTNPETGMEILNDFLRKLRDEDTNYMIFQSLHNEIDIEEEEIETDDPNAKDQVVFKYIKNLDKAIAVEGVDDDKEPSDEELARLFRIMNQ